MDRIAQYHLPGLFEFYELYRVFLPLYCTHRDWFYPWCDIASLYGSPADCLWGGGRVGGGDVRPQDALALAQEYGISARLTFSNSLLQPEHLADPTCNKLCRLFAACDTPQSGVIVHSELLLDYLKRTYPSFYFVSSTTKVLTEFSQLAQETAREDFRYVVPDFRLNKAFDRLGCRDRKVCYEAVSRRNLGMDTPEHRCTAPDAAQGYRFSRAMESPSFISIEDILTRYLPQGFTNFKIEGRGLGSAIVLEFLLYYLTKPEYQLRVREEIYLDSMLDLF